MCIPFSSPRVRYRGAEALNDQTVQVNLNVFITKTPVIEQPATCLPNQVKEDLLDELF